MTEKERDAIDEALIAFRQIECIVAMIRKGVDHPGVADAPGGLEVLCGAEADRLDSGTRVRPSAS